MAWKTRSVRRFGMGLTIVIFSSVALFVASDQSFVSFGRANQEIVRTPADRALDSLRLWQVFESEIDNVIVADTAFTSGWHKTYGGPFVFCEELQSRHVTIHNLEGNQQIVLLPQAKKRRFEAAHNHLLIGIAKAAFSPEFRPCHVMSGYTEPVFVTLDQLADDMFDQGISVATTGFDEEYLLDLLFETANNMFRQHGLEDYIRLHNASEFTNQIEPYLIDLLFRKYYFRPSEFDLTEEIVNRYYSVPSRVARQ